MVADIASGCDIVHNMDSSGDGMLFNCGRTWEQECGCLPAPDGFSTTDPYSTFCPANPCYSTNENGGQEWSNLLDRKKATAAATAFMLSSEPARQDDGTLIRMAGGITCLAVGAVLLVARAAAGRRRRSGYAVMPLANQEAGSNRHYFGTSFEAKDAASNTGTFGSQTHMV
jgi:hypothetical protein